MRRFFVFALLLCSASTIQAQIIEPPEAPINWAAGAVDSTAYHWNNFSLGGTYPGAFTPDQASWHPGLANAGLTETTGQAFLTGGGNIYSPAVAAAFTVTLPNYNRNATPGGSWSTDVYVQTRTLGSELNYANLTLGWIDASGSHAMTPVNAMYSQELERVALGGFGGFSVTRIWGFNVAGNPDQFTLNFAGAESSVSLDQVRVDTMVTAVPEPSSLLLAASGALFFWRRRKSR